MRFSATKEEEISLNLAPLIDVVFLLLIFFMVTTSFNKESVFDLTLPAGEAKQGSESDFSITIDISNLDQISIENSPALESFSQSASAQQALSNKIQSALQEVRETKNIAESAQPTIIISADKLASHGKVIQLMNAISQLNINQIQFAIDSTNSTK